MSGQFTVYHNLNTQTKAELPFLLDVQSDLLDLVQTRVVIPMSPVRVIALQPVLPLVPVLEFREAWYALLTPQLAGIATHELGAAAGSLGAHRRTILDAIDFLLDRYTPTS